MSEDRTNQDLSFLDDVWPDMTDEQMESETNPGLKVPAKGVRTVKKSVLQASGESVPATIQTWEEIGFITKVGVKAGNPEGQYADLNPVNVWIQVQIAEAPEFGNTNAGRFLNSDFLRFYPKLLEMTDEALDKIKEGIPEGSKDPKRKWKARKWDTKSACRKMAALLKATGYTDRLTKGTSGYQSFRSLASIADLLEDNGKAFTGIPVKIHLRKGLPDFFGEMPDHEIITYEAVTV